MNLYLIRHGIAAERGLYAQDCDRPLTDKGRDRTQQVGQRLRALGLRFDHLLTSPFLRAQQTAEILQDLGLSARLEVSDLLVPDSPLEPWLQWLHQYQQRPRGLSPDIQLTHGLNLALVGHEPTWGNWAEQLIWGQSPGRLQVKKAGVIGLSLPCQGSPLGKSELFWLTPPRLML